MTADTLKSYNPPEDYLQQGDIFRLDIVAPIASTEKRIFRAADGRHGSEVFAHGVPAKVFGIEQLRVLLAASARGPHHVDPFTPSSEGLEEFVVVHGKLHSYFIIASQTCDISGVDKKKSSPACIILPIVTVQDTCRATKLPLETPEISIEAFLVKHANGEPLKLESDAFAYSPLLKNILDDWKPVRNDHKTAQSQIRNFLNNSAGWSHLLPPDPAFKVPHSHVDMSIAHAVPTVKLAAIRERGIATLTDLYRASFANALAQRLSRVALPAGTGPRF